MILCASPVFWFLFVGRILAGITGASFTVAGGYMADPTPTDKRASAFGMVAGTLALGKVIGPALGGYLTEFWLRVPFIVAAALSAINVAATWLFVPASLALTKLRPFKIARANPVGAFAAIAGDAILWRLVVAVLTFAIATQVFPVIWPFYTVEAFGFTLP